MKIKKLIYRLFPGIVEKYITTKNNKKKVDDIELMIKNDEKKYRETYGLSFNIKQPTTFYEKISFLKYYGNVDNAHLLVDKIKVKEILEQGGDSEKTAKIIAVFYSFNAFKKGVRKVSEEHQHFVLKLNHTSGGVWFYHNDKYYDKFGEKVSKRFVFACLKQRINFEYFKLHYERVYKSVKPAILLEEYLPSPKNKGLDEYKFFCAYGKPVLVNVIYGRQEGKRVKEAFTDIELNVYPVWQTQNILDQNEIYQPSSYKEMIDFCGKYCKDHPFVRVDLMVCGDTFRFCEFTFYDCAGINVFYPVEWNKKMGDLIPGNVLGEKCNE